MMMMMIIIIIITIIVHNTQISAVSQYVNNSI